MPVRPAVIEVVRPDLRDELARPQAGISLHGAAETVEWQTSAMMDRLRGPGALISRIPDPVALTRRDDVEITVRVRPKDTTNVVEQMTANRWRGAAAYYPAEGRISWVFGARPDSPAHIQELRGMVEQCGGVLTIERMPRGWIGVLDPWGTPRGDAPLARAIKTSLDPNNVFPNLAPGLLIPVYVCLESCNHEYLCVSSPSRPSGRVPSTSTFSACRRLLPRIIPPPNQAGFHHCALIYDRGTRSAGDLAHYVSRTANGNTEWLFDSFLFLIQASDRGIRTENGETQKPDWEYQLNRWFTWGRDLRALDAAIAAAGTPPTKRKIMLSIPYIHPSVTNFGDVNGDGRSENLATTEGRRAVVQWYLNEAQRRFREAGFRHLELWGFYWMAEGISPSDEAIVRMAAQEVHMDGYRLLVDSISERHRLEPLVGVRYRCGHPTA